MRKLEIRNIISSTIFERKSANFLKMSLPEERPQQAGVGCAINHFEGVA